MKMNNLILFLKIHVLFIIHASKKVQEKAISKDPNAIRHIHYQSEHIKMFAIKQGCLLKYIKQPDYNMMYEAIDINPINIIYVEIDNEYVDRTQLLDLAIHRGARSIIEKSLEINDCEKNKAVLEALYKRINYNFRKENSYFPYF